MSEVRRPAAVPPALHFELGDEHGQTPRWLVYEAHRGGRGALLWAFLPTTIVEHRDPLTPMPEEALAAYLPLAEALEAGLTRRTRMPFDGVRPGFDDMARSDLTGILWLRTERLRPFPDPANGISADRLGQRIAADLAALHRSELLHLDVQPGLIGVSGGLLGAGIDIRGGPVKRPGNVMLAQPGYSAPELWDATGDSPLGAWTDIYAASATLYHFVTGELPPDFRDRTGDPDAAEKLAASLHHHLAAPETNSDSFVRAIVAGLNPVPAERPQDAAAWGEELYVARIPPPAPPETPPPAPKETPLPRPTATIITEALEEARARRAELAAQENQEPPRAGGAAKLLVWLALLLPAAALAAAWFNGSLDVTPPRATPTTTPVAKASSMPTPRPTPTPVRRIATGTAAGQEYSDDPEKLGAVLKGLWNTSSGLEAATALFMPYHETEDSVCRTPLRLHLRADGKGLLIQRPTGVIWVTSWRGGRDRENEVTLSVDSIWDKDGEIDVPGLTGAQRLLRRNGDTVEIVYLEDGEATDEKETFPRCSISG